MAQKTVHIGQAIEEKLQELKMSKTEFGRKMGIPQQNVNRILEKETIDTGKLVLISEILKYNFFALYCDAQTVEVRAEGDFSLASNDGNVSFIVGDPIMAERITHLELMIKEKDERLAEKNILIEEKNERIKELKERVEDLKCR